MPTRKLGRKPGTRKTGGRRPGSLNKVTAAVKEVAQVHTEMAINVLVEIAEDQESPPAARVGAANALLDRAHGKPTQGITGQVQVSLAELLSSPDPNAGV